MDESFKELADAMVGPGRLESWKRTEVAVLSPKASSRRLQSLLLGPSSDWLRPTQRMEDNVLYSVSTDLNANHI